MRVCVCVHVRMLHAPCTENIQNKMTGKVSIQVAHFIVVLGNSLDGFYCAELKQKLTLDGKPIIIALDTLQARSQRLVEAVLVLYLAKQ